MNTFASVDVRLEQADATKRRRNKWKRTRYTRRNNVHNVYERILVRRRCRRRRLAATVRRFSHCIREEHKWKRENNNYITVTAKAAAATTTCMRTVYTLHHATTHRPFRWASGISSWQHIQYVNNFRCISSEFITSCSSTNGGSNGKICFSHNGTELTTWLRRASTPLILSVYRSANQKNPSEISRFSRRIGSLNAVSRLSHIFHIQVFFCCCSLHVVWHRTKQIKINDRVYLCLWAVIVAVCKM